jgi:aerobic-type carbon monoxide dehydrogenase small subunit (CoxS/CutS family)
VTGAPRPGIREIDLSFEVDGTAYSVRAWTDMSALQVVRDVAQHPGTRWRCEAGLCGSCEVLFDGRSTRLCSVSSRRLADATIVLAPSGRAAPP